MFNLKWSGAVKKILLSAGLTAVMLVSVYFISSSFGRAQAAQASAEQAITNTQQGEQVSRWSSPSHGRRWGTASPGGWRSASPGGRGSPSPRGR